MKALVNTKCQELQLQDVPIPDDDFLVKVKGCCICGTDLKTFLHGHPFFKPPVILGHEFYGEVVKTPEGTGYNVGDLVVVAPYGDCGRCEMCKKGIPELCQSKDYVKSGAFCEYVGVPLTFLERGVIRLEEDNAVFALTEPLACVLTAVEQLKATTNCKVLIIGGGPMGTLFAMTLMDQGVPVRVAELNEKRRACLENWEIPCDTLEECYKIDKYDRIVVAVNKKELIEEAVQKVSQGGIVHVFAGLPSQTELCIPGYDIHYRKVSVMGSSGFSVETFHKAYETIHRNPKHYARIITHRFPLEEGEQAFKLLSEGDAFKVVLEP